MIPEETIAVRYHENGAPNEVLRVDSLPLKAPGAGEVTLKLLAAPVHPSDLGMIAGTYGRKRDLPAIGGREGLGEVVAVGAGVADWKEGDRARMPEQGSWVREITTAAEGLVRVPREVPVEQGAMAFVNPPTAVRLLADFVDLQPGDWVLQNAGNSAVGFCVVAWARKRGLKTISTVREVERWQEPLQRAGADVVEADTDELYRNIKQLTGGPKPRLALNSIGGDSVVRQIRCLDDGGSCVTFGGMVGDKVRYPTRNLIFNDISLRGFWMDRWWRTHSEEQGRALMQQVFDGIREGVFEVPIAQRFSLREGPAAVAAASGSSRPGKVLFVG